MVALSLDDVFVRIADPSGVGAARRAVSRLARRVGFEEEAVGRVSIAVTELASNLLRHADEGELFARPVEVAGRPSLEVVTVDRGPGIADPARAMEDGYTTAGGAGTGLGAVARMSDDFVLHSPREGGTVCAARVDAEPSEAGDARRSPLDMGAIRRPHPLEDVSGDAWALREEENGDLLVLVCDGLGHGREAGAAAERAVEVFDGGPWPGMDAFFDRLHRALRPTRGAAVAVTRVDRAGESVRYAGVGNIAGAVVSGPERVGFVSRNGTVGHQMRSVVSYDYGFPSGSLLVLHSDGIKSRWDPADLRTLLDRPGPLVAGTLYLRYGRARDDATVLVMRNGR